MKHFLFILTLLHTIAAVESGGNDFAVGDGGMAVGRYQITPIYLADVNRIAGTCYTLADRTDPVKAAEMVRIYLAHYGRRYIRITGRPITAEVLSRIHNGGPDGWRKQKTEKYWRKVKGVRK